MGERRADSAGARKTATEEERWVVGLQPVREALRVYGERILKVRIGYDGDGKLPPRLSAVARFAEDRGVRDIEVVASRQLDRLAGAALHQGVAALVPPLELVRPDELLKDPALLAIALDGIQDPQNFGAVIRSAVGLASAAVVWGEHGAAPLSLATFRASAGAIEHARLCRVRSLREFLMNATAAGVQVIGLEAQAERALSEVDLTGPTIILLGSEHAGIHRGNRRACTGFARVVRPKSIESLNASVAAAVALYESQIQRDKSNT